MHTAPLKYTARIFVTVITARFVLFYSRLRASALFKPYIKLILQRRVSLQPKLGSNQIAA